MVHDSNADGTLSTDIAGLAYVTAGSNNDVVHNFNDDFVYVPGQTIYTRCYLDDAADEMFTFEEDPTTDVADFFGFGDGNFISGNIVIE